MRKFITHIVFCFAFACCANFSFVVFAQQSSPDAKTQSASPAAALPAATPVKKINQRPNANSAKTAEEPFAKMNVETLAAQCVTLETEAGAIELEMFPESAPETVRNFLNLVAVKAYDTTTFSRVVPDFVIQGGDLFTREKITPELDARARRTIADEPNQIKHERGIISMARAAEPNSATTNFFILTGSGSHLDGTFAAFGRVTKGMETVDAIGKMPVVGEKPKTPVRLKRASVAACIPSAK